MRLHHSFLLLLGTLPTAFSWGELGHRTVAYLAWKYIDINAADMLYTLLENDRGWDISDAAIWADVVRRREGYTHTGAWHFIDAKDDPPLQCYVNYTRDCNATGHGCIVSALVNQTDLLVNSSPDIPFNIPKEALMFTIHFLGDIHQPLHTENMDRGGNGIHVCFDSKCGERENLHSVWDTGIPHKHRNLTVHEGHPAIKVAAKEWADELYINQQHSDSSTYDVEKIEEYALNWASEANQWVCGYVLRNGVEWVKENDLGGEYFEGAREVVDELVGKAGERLGRWLNVLGAEWVRRQEERMEM